ncbi:ABC transporter substrate-binding protein [Microbacterium sp. LWH12-1.2]|uniref:ABC transporter substrate-binding protein n=1 Tax=Microbacterium sp. LWH12-1.2 TaxID=3135259 RepID=UPI003417F318
MKTGKKAALAAIVAGAALALAGCNSGIGTSSGGESGGEGGGEEMTIALIAKGYQHQFWQAVKQGAEQRAEELGVTVTFDAPATETEIDKQLSIFQDAINAKPAAIGFAALDSKACIPLVEDATAQDIPVVYFDAPCDSDAGLSLAATDNTVAGALAAEHMAELIGGSGQVAIIGHQQTAGTGADRRDGFEEKIKADYPDVEIVDIQYGDGDQLKSADIAKALIAAHPDLKGIYGTNEGSAIGVVNAANELGLKAGALTIIGFDSGKAQIDAINNGLEAGAITQDPIGIGEMVVQAAYDAAKGKTVEKFIDTGSHWYDKSNIEDPEIAAVLYE